MMVTIVLTMMVWIENRKRFQSNGHPLPTPQKKLEYVLYCRKTYASKIRNDDNETANSYTM